MRRNACRVVYKAVVSRHGISVTRGLKIAVVPAQQPESQNNSTEASDASSSVHKHWLDRRFPGVREWLEAKNRQWWLKGLSAWCRKYPALQGQEEKLQSLIQVSYQQYHLKHLHRLSDERSQTHLQVACLVLATYKTLLPFIRNQEEVMDILRAHMGEQTSPMLKFLVRSTLWLSPNPYKTMSNRLKGLQLDYGKGFETCFSAADRGSELRITSCFYQNIFAAEELPQLTSCCCCSQDVTWFHQAQSRNISFQRSSCIGKGDKACCLSVQCL